MPEYTPNIGFEPLTPESEHDQLNYKDTACFYFSEKAGDFYIMLNQDELEILTEELNAAPDDICGVLVTANLIDIVKRLVDLDPQILMIRERRDPLIAVFEEAIRIISSGTIKYKTTQEWENSADYA